MKVKRGLLIILLTIAISLVFSVLNPVVFAEDATITITIQKNHEGKVTGKTVVPAVARIQGGAPGKPGGHVFWQITHNGPHVVQVHTIDINFPEGSPFERSSYRFRNGNIIRGRPDLNRIDSGGAVVRSGRYPYTVTVDGVDPPGYFYVEVAPAVTGVNTYLLGALALLVMLTGFVILRRRGLKTDALIGVK